MAGFDFLKATRKDLLSLKSLLAQEDHSWFVDLLAGTETRPSSGKSKAICDDEIYELACYFSLVKALNQVASVSWSVAPGDRNPFRFAYSPGDKENFAFFRFVTPAGVLDCVCGIRIPVPNEPHEAPDISIEEAGGLVTTSKFHGSLLAIWEAKYHKQKLGEKVPLNKNELNQMIGRLSIFSLPRPSQGDVHTVLSLPEPFCVNAILTNSPRSIFNSKERYKYGFSIAFDYRLVSPCALEPTRSDHEIWVP